MDALDRAKLNRKDEQIVHLHEIFIRAYDDLYEALALAGQVGVLKADISIYPKLRNTWWSILEESAKEHQLRRLVEIALSDPTSESWHDQISAVLAAPPSQTTEAKEATEFIRANRSLRQPDGTSLPARHEALSASERYLTPSVAISKSTRAGPCGPPAISRRVIFEPSNCSNILSSIPMACGWRSNTGSNG